MIDSNVYYEVRYEGDGDIEFFSQPPDDPITGEINYNELDLDSAKAYLDSAKAYVNARMPDSSIHAYVVKITVEVV